MSEQPTASTPVEMWAIVELFGHSKIAGRLSEQNLAGAAFLRVDVPEVRYERMGWQGGGEETLPPFSRLYHPNAVYGIVPTSEERARAAALAFRVRPLGEAEPAVVRQIEAAAEERGVPEAEAWEDDGPDGDGYDDEDDEI